MTSPLEGTMAVYNSSFVDPPQDLRNFTKIPDTFGTIVDRLDLYFVPVIVAVGFVGNSISFIIFTQTHLRLHSSSVYLSALAVADTGFLLSIFAMWLHKVGVNLVARQGLCQLLVYFIYVWSFLSVWYVAAFTTERFIAVCKPLRRNLICSVKRAKIVVSCLGAFAALYYSYALWTSDVSVFRGKAYCMPKVQFFNAISILNYVDTFLTLLIPLIMLIVFNLKIILAIRRLHREELRCQMEVRLRRCDADKSSRRPSSESKEALHTHLVSETSVQSCSSQSGSQIKITKMLIIVSVTFLILNMPNHTVRLYLDINRIVRHGNYSPSGGVNNAQMLFQFVYYLNFGINVFLYAVFGSNFRKAGRMLLHSWKLKIQGVSPCCSRDPHSSYNERKFRAFTSRQMNNSRTTSVVSLSQCGLRNGRSVSSPSVGKRKSGMV